MNATPPDAGINRLPRPFGDMPWPVLLGEAQARDVLRQARRHCPDWLAPPPGFEYRVAALGVSFFTGRSAYDLVRVALDSEGDESVDARPVLVVYAFYAPGDFRPLDGEGREIERLRQQALADLSAGADDEGRDRVADYACLRLALEAPLAWRRFRGEDSPSEKTGGLFRPAAVVSTLERVPVDVESLGPDARDALARAVGAPSVDVETAKDAKTDDDKLYHVGVSLCIAERGGLRIVRAVARIDRDGAFHTDPSEWLDGGWIEDVPSDVVLAEGMSSVKELWRVVPVPGIEEWERVAVGGADAPDWARQLLGDHGLSPDATLLRRARLPFYRTFDLVEVLERRSASSPYRRSYLLVRFDDKRSGPVDMRPLNGKSYVIHAVNEEADELALDESVVESYLRFFCWAVHGDRGPFLIPASAREIPFSAEAGSRRHQARLLEEIDYRIHPPLAPEDRFAHYVPENGFFAPRRAIVAYGGAVFESWFAVETDGSVRMLEDTPLLADMPIEAERYGYGSLFELHTWKRSSRRPEPQSSWRRRGEPVRGRPYRVLTSGEPMSGEALRELVARGAGNGQVVVEDRDVLGPLVLTGTQDERG